jgi:hypothetical protein
MFYYISGKVALTDAAMVVIDAGGIGYALNTSYTSARSVKVGEQATFYTHLHVREDIFELFGFAGMPYYLITVAVSYMLSGNGGLYRKQQIVCSKTQLTFNASQE